MANESYILCHKCAGILVGPDRAPLHGCCCISGWVRGFEKELTYAEAVAAQIQEMRSRRDLYVRQGRSEEEIIAVNRRIRDMVLAMGERTN